MLLADATALRIHTGKTTVVPFRPGAEFEIRRFIVEEVPALSGIKISNSGKLLGVHLGPGACEVRWNHAADKFWIRGLETKARDSGLMRAIRYYTVYAFTTLQHMQFAAPDAETLSREARILQLMTRGPWNAFTADAVRSLKDVGFSCEAPAAWETSVAARFRAAVSSQAFLSSLSELEDGVDDVEALLLPRTPHLEADCCVTQMHEAYRRVTALPSRIGDVPQSGLQAFITAELRARRTSPWPALLRKRLRSGRLRESRRQPTL